MRPSLRRTQRGDGRFMNEEVGRSDNVLAFPGSTRTAARQTQISASPSERGAHHEMRAVGMHTAPESKRASLSLVASPLEGRGVGKKPMLVIVTPKELGSYD